MHDSQLGNSGFMQADTNLNKEASWKPSSQANDLKVKQTNKHAGEV